MLQVLRTPGKYSEGHGFESQLVLEFFHGFKFSLSITNHREYTGIWQVVSWVLDLIAVGGMGRAASVSTKG